MHTVICAFDDSAWAEEAAATLRRAGFARHDVHIEHRRATGDGGRDAEAGASAAQHEAGDRGVLSSFGHFFASLLGRDSPSGHAETYARHVERGGYVVVVDAGDTAQALRARALLHQLQGRELNVIERRGRQPLRDIVGRRDDPAGMEERLRETYESWSGREALARERAMASHRLDALGGPALHDPDVSRPSEPRFTGKDKPND